MQENYREIDGEEEQTPKRMQEETQEGIQENIGENSRQEEVIKNRETEICAGAFAGRFSDDEELTVKKAKMIKTYPAATKADQFITVSEEDDETKCSTIEPPLPSTSSNSAISPEQKIANITKSLSNKLKKLRQGDERTNSKMKRQIQILQKRLIAARLERKRQSAAPKRKKVSVADFLNMHHCHNPVSRAIVTMQLRRQRNALYTKDEKDLAKRFNYYSGSAYRYMRKAGLKLPAESTIRRWISEYDIKPRFSETIYAKFKEKMKNLPPDQRVCGLKWDDFSMKKCEEYSKYCDLIEGLVDLGPLGRRNISLSATNCLVFSVDSLNFN